jgi:hypothetical protein
LTLITCYPFYYVGYAPERMIVRAEPLADSQPVNESVSVSSRLGEVKTGAVGKGEAGPAISLKGASAEQLGATKGESSS